ncbi:nucleotidyl transferase AbiEii/AbiGii toxin family protein [Sporosarcina sp. CAU 1771]
MNQKKNMAASVFERLKNVSKKNGKTLDSVLLLYFQERLLYRLSKSSYKDKFLLKGGLFLFSLTQFSARPTRDIDFLATYISNEIESIEGAFKEIFIMNIERDDGVIFLVEQMKTERITEDADYQGLRIKIPAMLGRARHTLQLDIGFGDIVVPKPRTMTFPVLLDMEPPILSTYSIESVIAEKFEAMISLSTLNSRMKDFYDIYILSESNNFEGRVLQEAIAETFDRRKTLIEKDHPIFTVDFYIEIARLNQWSAFLKRTNITVDLTFEAVMNRIYEFIKPVYEAILHEDEFFAHWNSEEVKWNRIRR